MTKKKLVSVSMDLNNVMGKKLCRYHDFFAEKCK